MTWFRQAPKLMLTAQQWIYLAFTWAQCYSKHASSQYSVLCNELYIYILTLLPYLLQTKCVKRRMDTGLFVICVCNGRFRRYVKNACCACAGNVRNGFPATDFKGNRYLAIPTCVTARATRTFRHACRDRWPAVVETTFPAFSAHAQSAILRIW